MKTRIHVTRQDIRDGEPNSWHSCPVALAVSKRTGLPTIVGKAIAVRNDYIVSDDGVVHETASRTVFDAPRSVHRFIGRFDNGKPVKPFSFFI